MMDKYQRENDREQTSSQEGEGESKHAKSGVEQAREEKSLVKNLVSLLIVVVGLFMGSVFVDIVQLASGSGISSRALSKADVFEAGDKTWVAYNEPITKVTVLTDEECDECDPSQGVLFLRRYLPTMLTEEVNVNSQVGERLIESAGVRTLPAFIFDKSVEDTMFYAQASQIFTSNDEGNQFTLDVTQLGLPVGKYLALPGVDEGDIIVGNPDAPVTIVEYSDFQCPYCQLLHPSIRQALEEFDGQIRYVYKHLPLSFHLQAENAALASECANEQGKFIEYADILFENQSEWGETEGTSMFKSYATRLGLNATSFNQCLDSQRYMDKVLSDVEEAGEFGVNGTPGTFVGEQFLGGAAQYENFKLMIEKELEKQSKEGSAEETRGDA